MRIWTVLMPHIISFFLDLDGLKEGRILLAVLMPHIISFFLDVTDILPPLEHIRLGANASYHFFFLGQRATNVFKSNCSRC